MKSRVLFYNKATIVIILDKKKRTLSIRICFIHSLEDSWRPVRIP